jgi:hypothetical protein
MKMAALLLIAITLTARAEWGDPRTQQRDAYPREGWLPITRYADPVSNGYQRVMTWINSTNGVEAFEEWTDQMTLSPSVLIPRLDANGVPTGLSRLLAAPDNTPVLVTHSASPERALAVQIAEFVEIERKRAEERAALMAALAALGKDTRLSATTRASLTNAVGAAERTDRARTNAVAVPPQERER